jgi:flagellar hook-associated protein 1 FlgK
VPFIAGATYSYAGVNFVLGGAPANGDTFSVGQLPATTSAGATVSETTTTFSASLPTSAYTLSYNSQSSTGYATGNAVVASPTTITAGVNDSLNVTVDGTAVTATLSDPGGLGTAYTPAALAAEAQNQINASLSAAGSVARVTASINANGELVIASNSLGKTSSVAVTGGSAEAGILGLPTSTPGADGNILTGFPPGSTVAVTVNGTTTEVPITSPNTGVTFTSGMQLTVNGVSLSLTGTPQNGDTFIVAPTTAGTSDNRNMQLLSALQTAKTMLGGSATYEGSYAQLVSSIGNKGNQVSVMNQAQQAQLTQAQNNQQSFSGVNLDEEAANLIRYQQQYQAAAKIISVAGKLFDLLTNL